MPFRHFLQQFRQPLGTAHLEWLKRTPNDGLIRLLMLSEESILATTPEAIEEVMNIKSYDFQKPAHLRSGWVSAKTVPLTVADHLDLMHSV